ncbi:MAG: transglycosylase SLT domain-containing protein [Azospirillum sp.]|nr:transglycosylase SLT domain-containing protein [Azospirillum sp.]
MRPGPVLVGVMLLALGLPLAGGTARAAEPAPAQERPRFRMLLPLQPNAPSRLPAPSADLASPTGLTAYGEDCAAAERGKVEAAYRLGRRFLFGFGVPRDKNMGLAWMRAAASRGHRDAARLVALIPPQWGLIRPWCRSSGGPVRGIQAPPAEIAALVDRIAPQHGIDPALVRAVIQVESAYHTDALSPKAAAGLMQLIPATAARFGVRDVYDPAENIRGGVKYLRWLLAYFRGNVSLALAGYNAGERAVDRYGGVPPYPETTNYVRLIERLYGQANHRFDPAAASPSTRFFGPAATAGRP